MRSRHLFAFYVLFIAQISDWFDSYCCRFLAFNVLFNNSGRFQKAQDISHHLTVSNQDLKQFSTNDLLGFAAAVFHGFLPLEINVTTKLTM